MAAWHSCRGVASIAAVLVGTIALVACPPATGPDPPDGPDPTLPPFDFSATYLRIIDEETYGVSLYNCDVAMSNDGTVLAGYTYNSPQSVYVTSQFGPPTLWEIADTTANGSFDCVAVSGDGSTAYAATDHDPGGGRYPVLITITTATPSYQVLSLTAAADFTSIFDIDCTGDGSTVYINDFGVRHIWTCDSDGGNLTELIDPSNYTDGTRTGSWIDDVEVDDTGSHVAFNMQRWSPFDDQDEIFTWTVATGFTRMTFDDEPEVAKASLGITPDGSRLLFRATGVGWFACDYNGTPELIPSVPLNGVGVGNGDLSLVFRSNTTFTASGGTLSSADGDARELFAGLGIDADGGLNMNAAGDIIAFTHTYKSSPSVRCLYSGLINDMSGQNGAPVIEWIRIVPPEMSRSDPEAEIAVTVQISDVDGLATIESIGRDVLVDGMIPDDDPVNLGTPRDDGGGSDPVADDGAYTLLCTPSNDLGDFAGSAVTIRIGVEDTDGNASVADISLPVTP